MSTFRYYGGYISGQSPIKVSDEAKERIRYLAVLSGVTQEEIVDQAVREFAMRHSDLVERGIDRARSVLAGGDADIAAHPSMSPAMTCNESLALSAETRQTHGPEPGNVPLTVPLPLTDELNWGPCPYHPRKISPTTNTERNQDRAPVESGSTPVRPTGAPTPSPTGKAGHAPARGGPWDRTGLRQDRRRAPLRPR